MKKILLISLGVVVVIGSGYFIADTMAEQRVEKLLDQFVEDNNFSDVDYEALDINLFNQQATLKNVMVSDTSGNSYTINQIVVSNYDYENIVPHFVDITLRGISFSGDSKALLQQYSSGNTVVDQMLVNRLNEGELPVEIQYAYTYKPENANELISKLGIGLEQYFQLNLDSTMRNIPLESLAAGAEQMQANSYLLISQAEIPSATLMLQDQGVVNQLITFQSSQLGIPEDSVRRQMIAQIQSLYLFAPPELQEDAMKLGQELGAFLEGGKTFTLSSTPAYEGKMASLQPQIIGAVFQGNYAAVLELLNISFHTE